MSERLEHLDPCKQPGCPCLAASHTVYCTVHRQVRKIPYSGLNKCPRCQKAFKKGDLVQMTGDGNDYHVKCKAKE